jgi:hypothetical protein
MDKHIESEMAVMVGKVLWEKKIQETASQSLLVERGQEAGKKMCINTGKICHCCQFCCCYVDINCSNKVFWVRTELI